MADAAGHGVDGYVFGGILVDEERVYEIRGEDYVLTDHGTNGGGLAVTAGTGTLGDPEVGLVVTGEGGTGTGGWVKVIV